MGVTTRSGKSTSCVPLRRRGKAPANSFHRFSELPKELRAKIWKAARPNRILKLSHHPGPPSITVRKTSSMLSGKAWDEVRGDYTTIPHTINGIRRLTTDLQFCEDADTLYISDKRHFGVPFYGWLRLLCGMKISFGPSVYHLAIHFNAVYTYDFNAIAMFSLVKDLCIVVGQSPVKTRTKIVDPRKPIKFGRVFRGEGTEAEFLARVTVVEDMCRELVGHMIPTRATYQKSRL